MEGRRYIRVVERDDGRWTCRQGRSDLSTHPTRDTAIEHAVALASDIRPAEVILHHRDGDVQSVMSLD